MNAASAVKVAGGLGLTFSIPEVSAITDVRRNYSEGKVTDSSAVGPTIWRFARASIGVETGCHAAESGEHDAYSSGIREMSARGTSSPS